MGRKRKKKQHSFIHMQVSGLWIKWMCTEFVHKDCACLKKIKQTNTTVICYISNSVLILYYFLFLYWISLRRFASAVLICSVKHIRGVLASS